MEYDVNYSLIPEHVRPRMKRYLERGLRPGEFVVAVLENNLVQSVCRADRVNLAQIVEWAKFLYNEMPMESWGSKEKVNAWIKKRRKYEKNKN